MLRTMDRSNAGAVPIQQRSLHPVPANTPLINILKQSWTAFIVGIFGLFGGIIFAVWNEARAMRTSRALEESISTVRSVLPYEPIDAVNVGKLIYVSGKLLVEEPLTEIDYGVSVSAVILKRRVQMYQWVEETATDLNDNGVITETSYYYFTDWKDKLIDSSSFQLPTGHKNPKEFPIKSQIQMNENVKVGNYILGPDLKKMFSEFVQITSDERPERRDIKLHSGLYYHSQDVWNPSVGDIRLQFSYAGHHGQIVSIVGQLNSSNTIVPFKTKPGIDVLILKAGYKSVAEIFASEQGGNNFSTWLYRVSAWFFIYIGCIYIIQILECRVECSRLCRNLFLSPHSSLKMTASMCIFFLAIALAWIRYRPVLGLGLVIATIFLLFMTRNTSNQVLEYNRL